MAELKKTEKDGKKEIVGIPMLKYFDLTYARGFDGDDQKAADTFKMFESKEKLQSLRLELQWLKEGRVSLKVCHNIIGKKRFSRYTSYEKWSSLMLQWLAIKKG